MWLYNNREWDREQIHTEQPFHQMLRQNSDRLPQEKWIGLKGLYVKLLEEGQTTLEGGLENKDMYQTLSQAFEISKTTETISLDQITRKHLGKEDHQKNFPNRIDTCV